MILKNDCQNYSTKIMDKMKMKNDFKKFILLYQKLSYICLLIVSGKVGESN